LSPPLIANGAAGGRIAAARRLFVNPAFGLRSAGEDDTVRIVAHQSRDAALAAGGDLYGFHRSDSGGRKITGNIGLKSTIARFPKSDIFQPTVLLVVSANIGAFAVHSAIVTAITGKGEFQFILGRAGRNLNRRRQAGAGNGVSECTGDPRHEQQYKSDNSRIHQTISSKNIFQTLSAKNTKHAEAKYRRHQNWPTVAWAGTGSLITLQTQYDTASDIR
jgi:hypothetical protein